MCKQNVSKLNNCYGCGVCSSSCSRKIISVELNKQGFYEPRIKDQNLCTECGICLEVCAFSHSVLAHEAFPIKSWAAWSNDIDVRKKCSSGGIGFEIGKQLIEQGYHAIGCRYDIKTQRAEHYIATTVEDFVASIGSKYIQSYTEEAFRQINRKNQKYLIIGTPCQIDSFRRMIRKFRCEDNFVLLDFFCHCVPSMYAWKSYIKMLEKKIGDVNYASWRNKFLYEGNGSCFMDAGWDKDSTSIDWHDSYNLLIKGNISYIQSRRSQGDLFYKLFFGDIVLGLQCEKQCKYKYDKSSADIRIGDLWGNTYKDEKKGVSALIAFTEKGKDVVESLNNVTLVEHPFEVVAEGQMKKNACRKEMSPIVIKLLSNNYNIDGIVFKSVMFIQRGITWIKRLV